MSDELPERGLTEGEFAGIVPAEGWSLDADAEEFAAVFATPDGFTVVLQLRYGFFHWKGRRFVSPVFLHVFRVRTGYPADPALLGQQFGLGLDEMLRLLATKPPDLLEGDGAIALFVRTPYDVPGGKL